MKKKKFDLVGEVRKDVFHPIAPRIKGFLLLKRRIKQVYTLIKTGRFNSAEEIHNLVEKRYSQQVEVDYYAAIGCTGLYLEEKYFMQEVQRRFPHLQTALVIGCGTGRECIGLKELNYQVLGIDISQQMIDKSKRIVEGVDFQCNELKNIEGSFDLIFITFALTNHMIPKKERVLFLKTCRDKLKEDGVIFFSGYQQKIHLFDRFWWASLILKWKYRKTDYWMKGLTAMSHLGHHSDEELPLPFHFYQSRLEIQDEFKEASLEYEQITPPENFRESSQQNIYILRKSQTNLGS